MKIKNYTSEQAPEKSILEIEKLLVGAGATTINKFYEAGQCAGFMFSLPINGSSMLFKMPVQTARIYEQMYREAKTKDREKIRMQAERTGWKTLLEWVHINLNLVQLQQAEPLQIFLPYVYDAASNKTLYERASEGQIKLIG
jgi:hypothetical protein